MKWGALAIAFCGLATSLPAQQPVPPDPRSSLAELSDEFDGSTLDPKWLRFDKEFGWPDKLKSIDVGQTTLGALNLQPFDSAWVRDVQAPFLFQRLNGDFDVRARVRVRSSIGPIAAGTWSPGRVDGENPERPYREELGAAPGELAFHHDRRRAGTGSASYRDKGHLQQLQLAQASTGRTWLG